MHYHSFLRKLSKTILGATFSLIIAPAAANPTINFAISSCEKNSDVLTKTALVFLDSYSQISENYRSGRIKLEDIETAWGSMMELRERHRDTQWRNMIELTKDRSEETKLFMELRVGSQSIATDRTIVLLANTPYTTQKVQQNVVSECKRAVRELTEDWDANDSSRNRSGANAAIEPRRSTQNGEGHQRGAASSSDALMQLGLRIIGGSRFQNSQGKGSCSYLNESISGVYKTCMFECIDGNVTTTMRATDLCPLILKR